MVCFSHGDKTIVPDLLFSVELFPFDNPDKTRSDRAPGERRFVHKHQLQGCKGGRAGVFSARTILETTISGCDSQLASIWEE